MVTNTFSTRDQSIAKINMAMNYLSRVVRENMVLFNYDARTSKVSFLTENNLMVDCVAAFDERGNISLQDMSVNDAAELYSDESVDTRVNESVRSFISNLREDEYRDAESSFDTLLGAFQSRSQVNEVRAKLERRNSTFGDTQNILESAEYAKLQEVKDKVTEYLNEKKDTLLSYEDVVNSLKLSNALGRAFNTPRRSWDEVVKESVIEVPLDTQRTVFEMVCAQELIRHELNESKENFAGSWVKNDKIAALASCIYHDDEVVSEALHAAIADVPYLALASKADIKTVFGSIYEASDVANISQKDIREYVARIFEFKKPIKQDILSELNESYGINVQNLKFVPTFSNLAKAQSVLFEALAATSEKDSVVRDVFEAFSKTLRKKGGIQTLDVNDFIFEVFQEAEVELDGELFKAVDLDTVVESILEAKDKKESKDKKKEKNPTDDDGATTDDSLDPVGQGDADMDNDGDSDSTDKYLKNRRDAIGKAMGKKKVTKKKMEKTDEEDDKTRTDESEETDSSLGLGDQDMSELMQELEDLFKDIDWDSFSEEEKAAEESEEEEA